MFTKLIDTNNDLSALALRLTLAIVIFPHGAQKLLGWFGGPGFDGIIAFFTQLGIPAPLALLIIFVEFFGPIALALGLFGRGAALGVLAVMVGAVLLVHAPNGFFMNYVGAQPGEGIEYHLLAIGISLAVLIKGSGAYSVDRKLLTTATA